MKFFQTTLLGPDLIPTSMMNDMVHLSQEGPKYHTIVLDTIHEAFASGNMHTINQKKVSKYFNTQHGKTPEEKLSR